MTLTYEPLISPTLGLTLALVLAGLLVWYGWNRPWGIALPRWAAIITLMGLSGAALLAILLNPTWLESIPQPKGTPRLVIVVDDSASMDIPDGRSRFAHAVDITKTCLDKLSDRF